MNTPTVPVIGMITADVPFSDNVISLHEELIARASHTHPHFSKDNTTILDILVGCLKTTRYMSDLKPFQRTRNRRRVTETLHLHKMGNSKWDTITGEAENKVLNMKWNGKNSRYISDLHILSHRAAQNDMLQVVDCVSYQPSNEYTRVERLLKLLESTDLILVSV